MAKKLSIQAGDVVLIPLSESQAVLGKVLYIYTKQFKGVLMVGVATDRVFDPGKPPEPRVPAWQLVKFTLRKAVDEGHWKILGRDPAPIPAKATMYRMAGGVFQDEEPIRDETKADIAQIPEQSVGGHIAAERHIRAELGMPQPPLDSGQPKKAPAKASAAAGARPGAFVEDRFWSMIEDAWTSAAPRLAKKRPGVAAKVSTKDADALSTALDDAVVPALKKALGKLSREELIAFDRILERKLYEIDRADVQRHTDGSDDGFLYARGFIVGMGRRHHDAVRADPSKAISDVEDEGITYLPHRVFEERFDEDLPASEISRETGSNKAGWP